MTDTEDPIPRLPDDPYLHIELKRSELAALILRLVSRDTWMGSRAQKVMLETFGDAALASEAADRVVSSLIRAHDGSL